MKKILSLYVATLAAITMTAQDIAVNIKLVAQSGGESTLLLASGNGVSSADNATLVAPLANTDNVAIYVPDGERYSIYATDGSFVNQPIAFITDRMGAEVQSYTLHFEDVLGGAGTGALTIKDLVTGNLQTIVDGETYGPFFVNSTNAPGYVAGTNTVIGNRFIINYDASALAASVTTNDKGWATFSHENDLIPVDAQTLYKGAISGDVLALDPVDYVPNGQGVLVKGEANTTYYFAAGSGSASFAGNDLKATATYNTSMENVFVLKGDAFLEYVGTNALAANKAYIQLPAQNGAPKRIRMVVNGATGVENVQGDNVQCTKVIENGQIYILHNGAKYNVQGQIVK